MANKLRPKLEGFHAHLQGKREGDIVTAAELMAATTWEPATLQAHLGKNALTPFLTPIGGLNPIEGARFRLRRDGATISREDVTKAFTQIRPAALNLSPGLRLRGADADYELNTQIGRGAVAQVWRCHRVHDRGRFALKIVDPRADLLDPTTLSNVKERFGREARNGRRLSHVNIVPYIDVGRHQENDFLIMDLADDSLSKEIGRAPLTSAAAMAIIPSCVAGLKYLHDLGCVHRDIKPHNILRFGNRHVLGDLGIVRWSDMNPAFTSAGTITRATVQLGSWYYMAPEQRVAPHDASPASDIYALGMTWFEMLTGRTLDPSFVAAKVFTDPCADSETCRLIRQMLEFDPSKRPTSDDILRDLGRD